MRANSVASYIAGRCVLEIGGVMLQSVGYRGLPRLCRLVEPLLASRSPYVVRLDPDSVMRISLHDPHWARLLASSYSYEKEVAAVLRELRSEEYGFVDGGANYGYWSIRVSGLALGSKPAVAVEASSTTFERLADNCTLNRNRFACVHRALSSPSNGPVVLRRTDNHAARHVLRDRLPDPSTLDETAYEIVPTITVDEIVETYFPGSLRQLVVKLDIEGHEPEAMAGATQTLKRETLLVYEDHGADRLCRSTAAALGSQLKVYFVDSRANVRVVRSIRDVTAIKKSRGVGYNFLACRPGNKFDAWLSATRRLSLS